MPIALANCLTGRRPVAALVVDGVAHDLGTALGGGAIVSLAEVYADWDAVEPCLADAAAACADRAPLDDVRFLGPSLEPGSIFFAGFNYRDHVANMMQVFGLPDDPDPKTAGIPPWHNLKPRNSLCGPGDTVELPTDGVDWEIELAVVIGRRARNVGVVDALHYVAGYTVAIDLSARDRAFRPHTPVESVARMDWIAQKGFDGACPVGPWLTPAIFVPDVQSLDLKLTVNGESKQDSSTRHMIFSVAECVAHLSSLLTLSPGDLILTGTPAGTGAERRESLKRGDIIRASIGGLGDLEIHTR